MIVVFPASPGTKTLIDPAFEREMEAARAAGCKAGVVWEQRGEFRFTFTMIPSPEPPHYQEVAIYRGWMLSTEEYRKLHEALWRQGYQLINNLDEYLYCHELPRWYRDFSETTPPSIWVTDFRASYGAIQARVKEQLGPGPYVVKDFVKSEKHYWNEACYIPGPEDIERVTRRFVELREPLIGGLVYRKYQPFRIVGEHPKSKMPLANEARFFVLHGRPILGFPYWGPEEGGADISMPEAPPDLSWTGLVKSNFYTVDIAQLPEDMGGGWVIVELGDGQVAGLPDHVEARVFYERLKERFIFPEPS